MGRWVVAMPHAWPANVVCIGQIRCDFVNRQNVLPVMTEIANAFNTQSEGNIAE
jgi:hypothetical protein